MIKRNATRVLAWILAAGSVASLASCKFEFFKTSSDETLAESESTPVTDTLGAATQPSDIQQNIEDMPRFDYFDTEVDLSQYATLDPSAYAADTFTLPADLRVLDTDVENYIRSVRYAHHVAVNGTESVTDQPLAWGDDAYVYYRFLLDGKELASASHMNDAEPTVLGLGSGQLTPLEEKMIGVVPADTSRDNPLRFTVTFPSTYGVAPGEEVEVEIYVTHSVRYTLPTLDRAFVVDTFGYAPKSEWYASDAALMDEFYASVRDKLVDDYASYVNAAQQKAVWDKLIEAATVTKLPQEEIDYLYASQLQRIQQSYESYKTTYASLDEFAPVYLGLTAGADWQAQLRSDVERQVKIQLLSFVIARAEGLDTVSEAELQREVDLWVEYYSSQSNVPVTDEEVKANVGLPALYSQAVSYKVQTFLLERMTFVYGE